MYSWDTYSTEARIADWTANGVFLFTTSFDGAVNAPTDENDAAYTGMATADESGTIVMEGIVGEGSREGQPFAFINGLVLSSNIPIETASSPDPEDGSLVQFTQVMLQWEPGASADSHNIYFGEDFDDVNDGASEVFRGNESFTFFLIGFVGYPYPDGLVPGTTYYWRVDEVEATGTIHEGDVWSFTLPSKTAYDPNPVNNAEFVGVDVTLAWTPGADSTEHHVYFGDNLQDVQAGTGGTDKGTVTDLLAVWTWH
jgi:hypothetical protein